jgi:hypothetical protein
MMNFGNLPINEAIERYFEKNDALKRGDLATLQALKSTYPQLFESKTVQEIEIILDYIGALMQNPNFKRRYDSYCRDKVREKLTLI